MNLEQTFAETIKKRREELGLSQKELSAIAKISIRQLYNIEHGQNFSINVLNCILIPLKLNIVITPDSIE